MKKWKYCTSEAAEVGKTTDGRTVIECSDKTVFLLDSQGRDLDGDTWVLCPETAEVHTLSRGNKFSINPNSEVLTYLATVDAIRVDNTPGDLVVVHDYAGPKIVRLKPDAEVYLQ